MNVKLEILQPDNNSLVEIENLDLDDVVNLLTNLSLFSEYNDVNARRNIFNQLNASDESKCEFLIMYDCDFCISKELNSNLVYKIKQNSHLVLSLLPKDIVIQTDIPDDLQFRIDDETFESADEFF